MNSNNGWHRVEDGSPYPSPPSGHVLWYTKGGHVVKDKWYRDASVYGYTHWQHLPPKPVKMVKKTIEMWVNVYKDGKCGKVWKTKSLAEEARIGGSVCVKLTGEYETEEE